ncbi:CidA/LrgA family protein [Falsibacillus albus]|uniref:CidA/LrgA family protein n=1 Tax=Falsibacillus albus TaxID=2478915 RepID=A0A3L7JX96_9BACI|nr:CidA/LrgA family protein [Falsibacillus albus]RLQ94281.1 CidA/LrgA family protein [Falsibacillus albus]
MLRFLLQLGFLTVIYYVSAWVVGILNLLIPAGVFGMILMYVLLSTGVIKMSYISKGSAFLIRHLGFFFIPIAVGLMAYGGLIKTSGIQILIMIVFSTVIGLGVTAGVSQLFSKREEARHGHNAD